MVSMYKGHLYTKEREKVYSREIAQLEKRVALNSLLKTPYIFNDKFLGWPTDKYLGGFSIDVDIIQDDAHKISTLDLHPNKKGQEKIAEYIHENI